MRFLGLFLIIFIVGIFASYSYVDSISSHIHYEDVLAVFLYYLAGVVVLGAPYLVKIIESRYKKLKKIWAYLTVLLAAGVLATTGFFVAVARAFSSF